MEDVWTMKKQLPDFMGTDPVGWIAAAERFFEKNEVPSRDKLQWAFMSMKDKQAMMWFYYWCEENPDADWKAFSIAMIIQFGAEYLTETHDEPKLKVIEAFTDDREEIRIKETDRESETIVIAERLETTETQRNEKEKQMFCDLTMVPPPSPNSINPLIAISKRGQLPEPQDSETVVTITTQPKSSDVNLFIVVGGVSVTNRVKSWKSEMKVERRRPHSSDLQPPSKPPNVEFEPSLDQFAKVSSRRELPAKPPDRSVALDRGGYLRADAERRKIQTFLLRPQPPPKPPYADDNSFHVHGGGTVTKGEEILEKERAKVVFGEWGGVLLNSMGQMHKSWPYILHNNNLSHVSSSGQHTSLSSHESPNGHSLSAVMCHQYTIQCELGQLYMIRGQAQINASLLMKKIKNCGRVETQELVPLCNNTWIHGKEGSVSKIPSLILWGPDHNFLYCSSIDWKIFLLGEYELLIQQALEINNDRVHDMHMFRRPLSVDISSLVVFEKIIDIFNDSLRKLFGSKQDKDKVFEFQGWSNMISCLHGDLVPKEKIDLLYELFQSQSTWNKGVYKIFNEHSSKKIIYLGFLKGSVKDSDGFANKKLRRVDEIEVENIVGVGYGNGNFKITFLPMYLKVYDHEQRLEKYTRAAIIIHYMMQPSLDRHDISIVAYGQNHSEKTHIMVDVANELDFFLAWPKGKEVNVCSWSSLIDRNDWLTTILGETLAQFWNTLMGSLEEMKTGFPFGTSSLRAFRQWDLGELNFSMATGTCDCCWNYLIIFYGWFNLVFDRGKLDGCKYATLRTRLI
ncbi:unnamed protein product [Trifolium pratense]|uniref:Uncharacterized protein n=1 Tax=Trifolium pratense TaxID=57577 RepID=A0ACB0KKE4_TRIPR|nr:unnamed protein product [Trifolium pratense]